MKNKNIYIFASLMILFLLGITFIDNSTSFDSYNETLNLSQEDPREDPRYTKIFESIYIDKNFTDVVNRYDWASGKGTIFDPYVIEEISLIGAQLVIKDIEFFIIRNCKFFNYSMLYGYIGFAGLSLDHCKFGTIENNIFENCSIGLSSYHNSEDLIISRNNFLGSHNDSFTGMGKAIYITDIVSVQILENYIYAYYDGIVVFRAEKILILNNRIETIFGYISDTGVYFSYVDNSSITDNDFFGCDFGGQEYNITLIGNNIPQTSTIEYCTNLIISGNKYYDLDGNLIGEYSNINDDDVLIYYIIPIIFGILIVCIVLIVKKTFHHQLIH